MQKNENAMHPADSLQLIESMINRAKNNFSDNGHLYLIWGWVVLLCSVSHFVLWKFFGFRNAPVVWLLTWVMAIYQAIYLKRNKRKEVVRTYTDDIIGYVWIAFIASMFIAGFALVHELGSQYYRLIAPVILVLYGIPTFLSGIILKFRPLIIGGICCWLLSIISNYIPHEYQVLMFGIAMITAWIIPGYALQSKFKRQHS
ncbi:hypothetical protein [Aridibaculum aurantiacum]|uniref:hypothetical protein n=1 Tax=Aridibaculum aurantiacum TaxID=2810307 RepID=UPI001A978927|nr:hypothetical protein [Aridibaculum aurantiacum]